MNKKPNATENQNETQKKVGMLEKVFATTSRQKILRSTITLLGFFAFFGIIFWVLQATGVLQQLDTAEDIKQLILQGGVWSYVVFVVIQFLQVTFIPIPALVTTVAGALVFGPWVTYFLSLFAVLLGSLFAFYLGKKFGRKLIAWIVGKEDMQKWDERLSRGKYLFFLMILFPGFPDDILCMLVGATPMTYKFFIMCNLIARPLVFIPMVFLGGGAIIPYSGWGIPVWALFVVVCAVLFYLSIRYQKQIEQFLETKAKELKRKFK